MDGERGGPRGSGGLKGNRTGERENGMEEKQKRAFV